MEDKDSAFNMIPPHRRRQDPLEARQSLILCLVVGAVGFVLGYVIAVLSMPHESLHEGMSRSGSTGWFIVGGIVSIAGLALLLVGVIGFGVKIGREAARV